MQDLYDVLIIGGGPAGLTAAIYTSRSNLKTLVVAGQPAGGQLMLTTDVENFPGFEEGILGPDLIEKMRKQAVRFGTEFKDENVLKISGKASEGFTVETDEKHSYKGRTVIVATGASAKWLNLENEQRLRGRGVSACATCDGFFFKDKVIAVVGGGDAAMEEATFLTKFASKVYLLVRGGESDLKASVYMQQKAKSNSKITFVYNTVISDVLGSETVEGLRVTNTLTNESSDMSDVKGLFIAIGHKPNTDFLNGFAEVGKGDYALVTDNTRSSVDGVFIAGDVSDHRYRQAITASGVGCMAALDAEKFLSGHAH